MNIPIKNEFHFMRTKSPFALSSYKFDMYFLKLLMVYVVHIILDLFSVSSDKLT